MNLNCRYFSRCGGCSSHTSNYQEHFSFKVSHFKNKFQEIINTNYPQVKTTQLPTLKFRTRTDVTIYNGKEIGFFKKDSKGLIDIEECQLFSDELQSLYSQFRLNLPQVEKGSARLRISPTGLKGLWLDLSNIDIKNLLDNKTYLETIIKIFDVIEIGQKKKILNPKSLKLSEPQKYDWFETYSKNKSSPLSMHVGSFSQTGLISNKILIQELETILNSLPKDMNWFEGCCGSGNLTFPLMSYAKKLYATEQDQHAVNNLQESFNFKDKKNVLFYKLNIYNNTKELVQLLHQSDAILMDPPRSGLGNFINIFKGLEKYPKYFIYVSCFADSLLSDLKNLTQIGYATKKLTCVDQFPFSDHAEWICLLELEN